MAQYEFRQPRLYVDAPLKAGEQVTLNRDAINYLRNVLRLKTGDGILVFNGRDGEWQVRLQSEGKRTLALEVGEQVRKQPLYPFDLHYLFAPIKHARLDYMVQKAVELGATKLQPVITQHTQVTRVNTERMRANAIEAAQQCGVLTLPEIAEPIPFAALLSSLPDDVFLVFCDEEAKPWQPDIELMNIRPIVAENAKSVAVLIGPEGGFSEEERAALLERKMMVRIWLGPRVLRADTAAVAALTLVQTILGDWTEAYEDGT